MSPFKALRTDAVLLGVIVGGFVLLAVVITVGLLEKTIDVTTIAAILGSLVSGSISVVVVLAAKGNGPKEDDKK